MEDCRVSACNALDESVLIFVGKLFEGLESSLRKEERGADSSEHEEGEQLENVVEPSISAADILQASETNLSDNGAELATGSRDTVSRGPIPSWEGFAWNDEGSDVRAEVLEEIGEAVEEDKGALGVGNKRVISEAKDDEEDGERGEAHKLKWLPAPNIDDQKRSVVSWDKAGSGQDEVADGHIVQIGVDSALWGTTADAAETDGSEDN